MQRRSRRAGVQSERCSLTPKEQRVTEDVRVERRGAVQWITIDRPARRNAINEAVIAAIGAGIDAAMADTGVLAIVLTGAGDQAFCAGADLKPGVEGAAFDVDCSRPTHYVIDLFKRMEAC